MPLRLSGGTVCFFDGLRNLIRRKELGIGVPACSRRSILPSGTRAGPEVCAGFVEISAFLFEGTYGWSAGF